MTTSPQVHIAPVALVIGWGGPDDPPAIDPKTGELKAPKTWEALPLLEALTTRHGMDHHAYGYRSPKGKGYADRQPRIRKTAIPFTQRQGHEPRQLTAWLDLDTRYHEPWKSKKKAAKAVKAVCDILAASELKGAAVYSTRAGLRVVWILRKPIKVTKANSYLEALFSLAAKLLAPVKAVQVDTTSAQWHRCFRLPYVVRDGVPTDPVVAFDDLAPLQWKPPKGTVVAETAHSSVAREHPDGAPKDPEMPAPHLWDTIRTAPSVKAHYTSLLMGQAFAKKGERTATMMRLLGGIAASLQCDDPTVLYAFLWRSVLSCVDEGSQLTLDELWNAACAISDRQSGANDTKAEDQQVAVKHVQALGTSPPVVRVGRSFYVRDRITGAYRPPVDGVGLAAELEAHGPVGLAIRTKTRTPHSASRIMADCGANAQHVIYEMGRSQGVFSEKAGGTMTLPACAPRDIKPKYRPEVHKWLELLGGELSPLLLDWLAALPKLDTPTCALYIQGPPSAGKGLLALSCANLWADAAVPFAEAIGQWTIGLRDCPVVHLDEGLKDSKGASTAFRNLVAESTHRITEKYQPAATIKGCPRIIITANGSMALPLTGQHSYADLQAVIGRILHVLTDDQPVRYLRHLGGRKGTKGWATKHVPQHIAWLAANREYTRGSRYLVQGVENEYHRDLLITAGINADILAAIAHQLGRTDGIESPGVRVRDGDVLVNTAELRRRWRVLLSEEPPSESEVGNALLDLSVDSVKARAGHGRGTLRYYRIPGAFVLRAANRLLISDGETLWAALQGKPGKSAKGTKAQGGQR